MDNTAQRQVEMTNMNARKKVCLDQFREGMVTKGSPEIAVK